MRSLLKWLCPEAPVREYTAEVRQGKRGRWRWLLRDSEGKLVAVAPVNPGKSSAFAAKQSLMNLSSGEMRIVQWKEIQGDSVADSEDAT